MGDLHSPTASGGFPVIGKFRQDRGGDDAVIGTTM